MKNVLTVTLIYSIAVLGMRPCEAKDTIAGGYTEVIVQEMKKIRTNVNNANMGEGGIILICDDLIKPLNEMSKQGNGYEYASEKEMLSLVC